MWALVSGKEKRTTVMIRNIPNKCESHAAGGFMSWAALVNGHFSGNADTQVQFLELLNETHAGEYSFVYLRIDYVSYFASTSTIKRAH
jgi:hypothetical protein